MSECTFIILGASGDLAKRKLFPALYKLVRDQKIQRYAIIGAARDELTVDDIFARAEPFVGSIDKELWQSLIGKTSYIQIDFDDEQSFSRLASHVSTIEKKYGLAGNRLIYLATPSTFFCSLTHQIGKSGIASRNLPGSLTWQRLIYEKPFGLDEVSARQINECIHEWFDESQIYRVDHYLTKELVSSIVLIRFTNIIFEPLWNHKFIDYVQINLSETLALEGRGRYYDHYGVMRDIVQNHGLQLLSLVAMELPEKLDAAKIQNEKTKVLEKTRIDDGFLGQYQGYRDEIDVKKDSTMPTFACLKLSIDRPRWAGVPFFIKAGKRLERKDTSIHIKFKNVDCTLKESCVYESDYLTIQIDPDARFSLQLNTKLPESMYEVMPIQLVFNHDYALRTATPESYEILLEQIIKGDQSVSVRFDEIEHAWSIVDALQKLSLLSYDYQPLTQGPHEALAQFAQKYRIRWRV
jgi:glucose-6-phosphate 1-dehydrogenase